MTKIDNDIGIWNEAKITEAKKVENPLEISTQKEGGMGTLHQDNKNFAS